MCDSGVATSREGSLSSYRRKGCGRYRNYTKTQAAIRLPANKISSLTAPQALFCPAHLSSSIVSIRHVSCHFPHVLSRESSLQTFFTTKTNDIVRGAVSGQTRRCGIHNAHTHSALDANRPITMGVSVYDRFPPSRAQGVLPHSRRQTVQGPVSRRKRRTGQRQ